MDTDLNLPQKNAKSAEFQPLITRMTLMPEQSPVGAKDNSPG
jgi:hypothetical protein